MNILVTGATGAIGQKLTRQLAKSKKHKLTVFVRDPKLASLFFPNQVQVVTGDITRPKTIDPATKNQDLVYHLVGVGSLTDNTAQATKHYLAVNSRGTRNLLTSCQKNKVRKIVYLSSLAAQGLITNQVVTDTTTPNPVTAYEKSKYSSEQVVDRFRKKSNLKITVLRPAQVYGPGMVSSDIKLLAKFSLLPLFPIIGSGCNQLPLIYSQDLVQTLISLSGQPSIPNSNFNIVRPDKITYLQLVQAIKTFNNSNSPIIPTPPILVKIASTFAFGWFPLIGKTPLITPSRVESIIANRRYDVSRSLKYLNLPTTNFQESINKTLNSIHSKI